MVPSQESHTTSSVSWRDKHKVGRVLRKSNPHVVLEERGDTQSGGWWATVSVDGVIYRLGLEAGRRVRLAYSKKYGTHWWGRVRTEQGKQLAMERVPKDAGVYHLLELADLVPMSAPTIKRLVSAAKWNASRWEPKGYRWDWDGYGGRWVPKDKP